jgi:hypothetical protein
MRVFTVRLPAKLAAEFESGSRERKLSKSHFVRERLSTSVKAPDAGAHPDISDLVGSVHGLPADLSARKKAYLRTTGYGQKRAGRRQLRRSSAKRAR